MLFNATQIHEEVSISSWPPTEKVTGWSQNKFEVTDSIYKEVSNKTKYSTRE
jgi:hypothetical protein